MTMKVVLEALHHSARQADVVALTYFMKGALAFGGISKDSKSMQFCCNLFHSQYFSVYVTN